MTRWKREFRAWGARFTVYYMPKRWQDWRYAKALTAMVNVHMGSK